MIVGGGCSLAALFCSVKINYIFIFDLYLLKVVQISCGKKNKGKIYVTV